MIRKAGAADLPAVLRIEGEQFANPWRREYFVAELANRFCHFFVAADPASGDVTGYLLFWQLDPELELHKVAVAGGWQGKGHASCLLEFFIRCARSLNSERAVLEVREHNLPAIRLYEKYAFRCVGRRPGYYDHPPEDALLYELLFKTGNTPAAKNPDLF